MKNLWIVPALVLAVGNVRGEVNRTLLNPLTRTLKDDDEVIVKEIKPSSVPVCGSTETIELSDSQWIWNGLYDEPKWPQSTPFYYWQRDGNKICGDNILNLTGTWVKWLKVPYKVEWIGEIPLPNHGLYYPKRWRIGKREDGMAVIEEINP